MITEEVKNLKEILKRHRPSHLFDLPSLQIYTRGTEVKLGTRKIFVDIPRGAYVIIPHIIELCDKEIKGVDIQEEVEKIKTWKNNPETDIGCLTENLRKMGIKWNIYKSWPIKPIIKINVNNYYRDFWIKKIERFIHELHYGNDSPLQIYSKAQTLTPSYEKIQEGVHRAPLLFELFFGKEYSLFADELDKIWKSILKLKNSLTGLNTITVPTELKPVFMDLKTIIQQIHAIIRSGYCLTGFILLRKILIDIGLIIFSLSNYANLKGEKVNSQKPKENWKDGLNEWSSTFLDHWTLIIEYGNVWIFKRRDAEVRKMKVRKITDLNAFKSFLKKHKNLELLELKDKFLMEQLDVLRKFKINVFTFTKGNLLLLEKDKEIYREYRKLSEVIHEPLHLDYPPFSSFLEYLGFLHHLRKVRSYIQEVVKTYRKIEKHKGHKTSSEFTFPYFFYSFQ